MVSEGVWLSSDEDVQPVGEEGLETDSAAADTYHCTEKR